MIGIFGGSGLYDLLENIEEVEVDTPYGRPSDKIMVGAYAGKKIAFLPRHGRGHVFPPHLVPYRANLFAFRELGVTRVLAPCACGSLQPQIRPGDFVIGDQFVDRTNGRPDTFFNGPEVAHVSAADPYCPELRELAVRSCRELGIPVHERGTVVVINGPRFSTRSESKWFQNQGWEVINMTQYPECILAKEMEMCYVNISLITDYDAGLEGSQEIKPVTNAEVMRVFAENNAKVKDLLFRMIANLPEAESCDCRKSLAGALMGQT